MRLHRHTPCPVSPAAPSPKLCAIVASPFGSDGDDMSRRDMFLDLALANPANAAILERLPDLGVDDCWLVAGCLYGPVWNALSNQPPYAHIKDYDIFYWNPDTSWEAEDQVIRRAEELFADLGIVPEVRNQARVPLWFEERFGSPYPQTACSADNIARFVVACTSVGVRPDPEGGFEVCAPFGFDDLFAGLLRCNSLNPTPDHFAAKCASYRERWPWLAIADD